MSQKTINDIQDIVSTVSTISSTASHISNISNVFVDIKQKQIEHPNASNTTIYIAEVTRLYTKDITYRFLIPHRFVEKFLEYDKVVAKLVEKLKVN